LRLIAFNETSQKWVTQQDLEKLMANQVKFMDITDNVQPKVFDQSIKLGDIPTQPIYKEYIDTLLPSASINQITQTVTQLGTFNTRYYTTSTGVEAAQWIYAKFNEIKGDRSDIEVEYYQHSWQQPSVIARIPGLGPNSDELVILGAHEDSVGTSTTARAPGADDDASGTATVIEAFRVLVENNFTPDRTLEFHTYAAEEAGLRGSQDIAVAYAAAGIVVQSMAQFDMTAYAATTNNVGIITDFTNANLTAFFRILVDTYSLLEWQNSQCGYGCSDHASFNRSGYRSAFPFETPFGQHSPYIHTASDTVSTLDFTRAIEFVKLAIAYAVELAGVGGL